MKYVRFHRYGGDWKVPNAFYRISIKLILKNDADELLVMQQITTKEYELPGGGIDWGENHVAAATRELKEELGIQLVSIEDQPFATEFSVHPLGYHTLKIYYRAQYKGDPADNEPEEMHHDWVSKSAFSKLDMPSDESPVLQLIDLIWPSETKTQPAH